MTDPVEYTEFTSTLLRDVAKSFGITYEQLSAGYADSIESRRRALVQEITLSIASRREAVVRDLLCQWVSEIEPVIWYDANGEVSGIGTKACIVIATQWGLLAKAMRDDFMSKIEWRE